MLNFLNFISINYKHILYSEPIDNQQYPFNNIGFFDGQSLQEKVFVDKSQIKPNASDHLEKIVDSYLDDHPDIEKAVAYREESPDS